MTIMDKKFLNKINLKLKNNINQSKAIKRNQ